MIKASALKRALAVMSYRQIHMLMALYDRRSEWITYIDISASTGIAVATMHGSSGMIVLVDMGAVYKTPKSRGCGQIELTISEVGIEFVESLYAGEEVTA